MRRQSVHRVAQRGDGKICLLEIHAGKAVDLDVEEAGLRHREGRQIPGDSPDAQLKSGKPGQIPFPEIL